ncbi:MAG: hypothetical protein QOJ70_1129 [Acidobacteriota bacterium]|jgi:hypothetical protein|nr:hypothetical protein [Acidobacteriota bacterium]
MPQVDARLALIRHAVFADTPAPRVSPLQRRRSRALALPKIPDEVREQYQFEFEERISIKVYSGMDERCNSKSIIPDCCAYHSTLLELGCVEFYDYAQGLPFVRGMVRCPIPEPEPVYCSRCESVAHDVVVCPFGIGDADVMHVARLRRDRRARREAAA